MQDEDALAGSLPPKAEIEEALRSGIDINQQGNNISSSTAAQAGQQASVSPDYQQSIRQALNGDAGSTVTAENKSAAKQSSHEERHAPQKNAGSAGSNRTNGQRLQSEDRQGVVAPLSEEMLSQHSAALDQQLSEQEGDSGQSGAMTSSSVLDKLQEGIKFFQLPVTIDSGGLFDEDEAAEGFVDSLEEFSSPDEQSRHSLRKASPMSKASPMPRAQV